MPPFHPGERVGLPQSYFNYNCLISIPKLLTSEPNWP